MSISTPLTKKKVSDHLTYNLWKYVILCAAAFLFWELFYTQTAYRVPQEKRVDVYIKSGTTSQEITDAFLEPLWKESVPDMELVSSTLLSIGDDSTSVMQLAVWIAAGEGDIYILPLSDFKSYASSGAFLSLEEYVAGGVLNTEGIDLSSGKVQTYLGMDDKGNDTYEEEPRLYGIPMDSLYGYMEGMSLDNRGMVMAVLAANRNTDNVVTFMNALIQAGRGEPPSWLLETE